jgi:hypothetical protein
VVGAKPAAHFAEQPLIGVGERGVWVHVSTVVSRLACGASCQGRVPSYPAPGKRWRTSR